MTKRLVSVYYNCFNPFHNLPGISEMATSDNPDDLRKDDIIIIHGGGDIHPSLYNKRVSRSYVGDGPSKRDMVEWAMIQRAKELGIPILGICRGAQMLCAAAGGYLIQHVNNHGGSHEVTTSDGQKFRTNSIHHQMMQPKGTDHELVAWTTNRLSDVYIGEDHEPEQVDHEPEFVYFNGINGFAFQWHPEGMGDQTPANQYILNYIQERIG